MNTTKNSEDTTKIMDLHLECYPCLLRMVISLSSLTGLGPSQAQQLMDYALSVLLNKKDSFCPPIMASKLYTFIHQEFYPDQKVFDPYKEVKKLTNKRALSHYDALWTTTIDSPDPLRTAIKIAAAGNVIDFGVHDHTTLDIDNEIDLISSLQFARFDYLQFTESITNANTILYCADNTGEIVFDKILLRYIAQTYPRITLHVAVREAPIINDATMEDALEVGLDKFAAVVSSGSIHPGTVLAESTPQFQELFRNADIIISKGQGNFETLSGECHKNLFFLFKVKCNGVAKMTGTNIGSLILYRQESLHE